MLSKFFSPLCMFPDLKPNLYLAYIAILFHYVIVLVPITTYFLTSRRFMKNAVILYILVLVGVNCYYRACPLILLERKLLGNPKWIGIHEILRVFGLKNPSKQFIEKISIGLVSLLFIAFWMRY